MTLGYIGLGKMGQNMVARLREKGHAPVAFDIDAAARAAAQQAGVSTASSLAELVETLEKPRRVWLMVPHKAVQHVMNDLVPLLTEGDIVFEAGNSPYKDSARRAKDLHEQGIAMLDVGVSGGPGGARHGACMMIGGDREVYHAHEALFKDLCVPQGYRHVGEAGAGHFVKMVHNGIEYGMMQAMAEGFDLLRHGPYHLNVQQIAELYAHGSVIESRLIQWLADGFSAYGDSLEQITGTAAASGEGAWTVAEADERAIEAGVIREALAARARSQETPNYQGRIVAVLRQQFGGHAAEQPAHNDAHADTH